MIAGRGRPLRFLAMVAGGWITMRVTMLWPQLDSAASVLRAIAPIAVAAAAPATMTAPVRRAGAPLALARPIPVPTVAPRRSTDSARIALALSGPAPPGAPRPAGPAPSILPGLPQVPPPARADRAPSRWSGSAWLAARGGAGLAPGTLGGQLGGSQAGVRLVYALNRRHRVALVGRLTSPLGSGLREASLGVEWQPTKLPVRLVAEHRFALAGGRGGPAVGVLGGAGPIAIPLGFRLEAYGQAGVIRRAATEPYADGAVRVARPLGTIGPLRFDLGAGVWGGAQRGAARLDIGPSLGVSVPLGQQAVRLALDWRERVGGDAHPGSGPALTLGSDF